MNASTRASPKVKGEQYTKTKGMKGHRELIHISREKGLESSS